MPAARSPAPAPSATPRSSGGTLAPGNSIGTLTVNGNLTFNAGSTYTVEFSPSAADRTNVTGAATLDRRHRAGDRFARQFFEPDLHHPECRRRFRRHAVLRPQRHRQQSSPGARNPHLAYDANNVFLVLDPGTIHFRPAPAATRRASPAASTAPCSAAPRRRQASTSCSISKARG